MSITNNSAVPGLIYPTQRGMLAGNPRDSAIAQMNNTNVKQAALASSVGGKKIYKRKMLSKKRKSKKIHYKRSRRFSRRFRRGGSNTIPVPQFNMLYAPQSGPGSDPNSQIQINSQVSTQGAANRVYDNQATIKGGKTGKKHRGGYNPNWHWGCYS